MNELKPCAHCRGVDKDGNVHPPKYSKFGSTHMVQCQNPECWSEISFEGGGAPAGGNKRMTIAAWNRRDGER